MTELTWRDYDTHLMQTGTTRNDTFHAVRHCPRIDTPAKTIKRNERYVAYHEPEPCPICHPEVPADPSANELVIVSERSDRKRYHRRPDCYYAAQMPAQERIHLHEAREEGLGPCKRCAAEDDDAIETIAVCPECDQPQIQSIIGAANAPVAADHDYRCNECGAQFDEPAERARQHRPGNPGGLAGALMEADPDDVSAENVGGGSA